MAGLFRRVLSLLGLAQIRQVSPVGFGTGDATVGWVYRQVEREFGVLAPPLALHAPAPDLLAGVWLMLRETLVVDGLAARPVKEAVAAAVSLGNACPYCVNVHSAALASLHPGRDAAAIAGGDLDAVADPQLRAVARWARASGDRQEAGRPVPFPVEHAPEVVGVAVLLHYLNRMVNVLLREAPMPPGAPAFALGPVKWVLGAAMRRAGSTPAIPGTSLDLLPGAALPADLAWAAGNPNIAAAFARASAAVDLAGARSVPPAVREMVGAELARWDGQPRGISRGWLDAVVTDLATDDRAAGRLALLMAFAAYQVDQPTIDEYRAGHPRDRQLVELAAWASLAAARRIGGWVHLRASAAT
jgi:AhpD family alkylhydroperoxidase